MKFFVLIFTIWTWQVCSSKPVTENYASSTISTQEVKSGDYPYHVLLRLSYSKKFPICEGVLIHKDFALTSAGCLQKYKQDPDSIEVAVGATSADKLDSDQNVQIRSASNIIIHQQWFTSKGKSGDIALVQVSKSFKMDSAVSLAKLGNDVKPKEDHILVTFGDCDDLRAKPKQIDSKENCTHKINGYANDGSSASTMQGEFCDTSEYDNSADNNFVGSPLVKTDKSTVDGITTSKSSTFYTSVSFYQDWIESITNPGKAGTKATSTAAPTTISNSNSTTPNGSTSSYQPTPTGSTKSNNGSTSSYQPTPPGSTKSNGSTSSYQPTPPGSTKSNGSTAPPQSTRSYSTKSDKSTTSFKSSSTSNHPKTTAYTSSGTTASYRKSTVKGTTDAATTVAESSEETTDYDDYSDESTTSLPTTTEEQDETTEESDESEETTTSSPTTTEEQDETTEESDEYDESTTQIATTEEQDETTEESDESEEPTTQIPTTEEQDETTEESDEYDESEETSTKPYSTTTGSSIPPSSRTTAHVGTSTRGGTTGSYKPTPSSGTTAHDGTATPQRTTRSSNPTSGSTARPGSTTSLPSSTSATRVTTSKPASTTSGDDDDYEDDDETTAITTATSTATTSKTPPPDNSDSSDSSDDTDDDSDFELNGAPNQPNDSEANSQKKSELLQDEPVSRNSAKQSLPLSFISSWMSKRNGIFDSMKKLKSFLTI